MKSCLLCGVGGQGTVLASRIIAGAALEKDWFARTAETIGMAQRGGCVVSHVRIGEKVASPLIPPGKADLIIGFEPGEAVRNLHYLKKDGAVIVCDKTVQPIAACSAQPYDGGEMLAYLQQNAGRCHIIPCQAVYDACGTLKALNIALLGAMAQSGVMDLTLENIQNALQRKIKPQLLALNRQALAIGAKLL
ncbi:MAG: indolepyruvate oxidoreductase subunit beta [Firmicutes bacterium]|nr:indolepyruvate oxidoreductase subunit beta [Bacillota bacterium]